MNYSLKMLRWWLVVIVLFLGWGLFSNILASVGGIPGEYLQLSEEQKLIRRVFPHITSQYRISALYFIAYYCRERGIGPVKPGRVRCFIQPWGNVDEAIEIDLEEQWLTFYSHTHSLVKKSVRIKLKQSQIDTLLIMIAGEAFSRITAENDLVGADGESILIEVNHGGKYTWKIHWSPSDPELLRVAAFIQELATPARDRMAELESNATAKQNQK